MLRNTCTKLKPLLEGIHIKDWPFQFFDIESKCMFICKSELLKRVILDVYVMPLANPNLESKKCMCVVDLDFV